MKEEENNGFDVVPIMALLSVGMLVPFFTYLHALGFGDVRATLEAGQGVLAD